MQIKVAVILIAVSVCGCVSTGKYKRLLSEKTKENQEWELARTQMESNNVKLGDQNETAKSDLVRQNTLLNELINDKMNLEREVNVLKDRINTLGSESKSMEADLNRELQDKNNYLEVKEAQLNKILQWSQKHQDQLSTISKALGEAMGSYKEDEVDWFIMKDRLDVIFYKAFVFQGQSISSAGAQALTNLSAILLNYPSLAFVVEGHTNNTISVSSDAVKASADQAVKIGNYLLDEGGINGNQLSVAGRGSYVPRVSNQTSAGQSLNNRVEVSIRTNYDGLWKLLE